ncbi:MAG: S-layer homology domain-containing protein, partial [Syntrophomonas sp.]
MRTSKRLTWLMTVMFVLTTMLGALPFQAAAAANVTDINGHWAQGQIQTMVDKGAIGGYPDNTFKPERITTRAEFISMTNRAFSFNETVEINYTDVESNDWFAPDIAKAKAAGYIAGYSDGSMKPNNSITRQEVAVIVANILELDTAGGTEALNKFTDAASIPAWSGNAIAAMVEAGYLSGYPDGTFKAANSTTRAVAAVILCAATGGVTPPVEPP